MARALSLRRDRVQQEPSPVKDESETEIHDVADSEDEFEPELEEISQDSTTIPAKEEDDGHDECPWQWRECRHFLSRLACLTEQGKPVPFKNCIRKQLSVDEEFMISGLHNGAKHRTPSMVQVNDTVVLSLDPEVVGTVLGIPWDGLKIPGSGNRHLRMRLQKAKIVAPDTEFMKDGAVIETLPPELRQYIVVQKTMLFLPGAQPGLIPVSQLFVLAQSLFHKKVFNWAEHRIKYVMRALTRDVTLPEPAKELLSNYIRFALKALEGFKPGGNVAAAKGGKGAGVRPERDVPPRTRSRTLKDVIDAKLRAGCGGRLYPTRVRARTGGSSPVASQMSTDEDVREQKRTLKRPAAAGGFHHSRQEEGRANINAKRRDVHVPVDDEATAELDEAKAELGEAQQTLDTMHRENKRLRKILAAREGEIAARKGEIATLEALVPALSYFHVKQTVRRYV